MLMLLPPPLIVIVVVDLHSAAAAAAAASLVVTTVVVAAIAAAAAAAVANVAVAATAVIRLQESSLCHLELLCKAALICVHSSFLQDLDLFKTSKKPSKESLCRLSLKERLPLDGLQPVLELGTALGRYLEGGACGHHNAGKLLVVALRQMVQLLVDALDVPAKPTHKSKVPTPFLAWFTHICWHFCTRGVSADRRCCITSWWLFLPR